MLRRIFINHLHQLSEELSLKNDEKHKNFDELESTVPAQKVAHTMPKTTKSFCSFSSHSADIQAITCCCRGSGDCNDCLEKLFSSYLKVVQNTRITVVKPAVQNMYKPCRSRKYIRGHIPMHAFFAVFIYFFIHVLSRSCFTSRTPDKDQKIEQLFYFLHIQVP